MMSEVEIITEKALKLSSPARACIVETLLESLDFEEDFPVSAEWNDEIIKRCHEIDSRHVELIAGEVAMTRLRETELKGPGSDYFSFPNGNNSN